MQIRLRQRTEDSGGAKKTEAVDTRLRLCEEAEIVADIEAAQRRLRLWNAGCDFAKGLRWSLTFPSQ